MQLTYRGVRYQYHSPAVDMPSEYRAGRYRGVDWQSCIPAHHADQFLTVEGVEGRKEVRGVIPQGKSWVRGADVTNGIPRRSSMRCSLPAMITRFTTPSLTALGVAIVLLGYGGIPPASGEASPPSPLSPSANDPASERYLDDRSPVDRCDEAYPRCPRLELGRLGNPRAKAQACPGRFEQLPPGSVLESQTYCQQGLTLPSLWWTQEQFGAQGKGYPEYAKLVQDWLTYIPRDRQMGRVDLVLELQRWSTMDYFKRYEFLTVFGAAAQSFGYNIRAFSFRGEFLGAYTCQTIGASCEIDIEGSGAQVNSPDIFNSK